MLPPRSAINPASTIGGVFREAGFILSGNKYKKSSVETELDNFKHRNIIGVILSTTCPQPGGFGLERVQDSVIFYHRFRLDKINAIIGGDCMRKNTVAILAVLLFLTLIFTGGKKKMEKIIVTSSAFKQGEAIPVKYTCKGADVSPEISWLGTPQNTKSIVLIADDPDAPGGMWVHWVVYNIPSLVTSLNENFPKTVELKDGTKQGRTDFGKYGYGGPCPPSGTHRYFFKVYALDIVLSLEPAAATKMSVTKSTEGHVLGYGELMGTFKK